MKRRWLLASGVLVASLRAVASAQSTTPLSFTAPPITLQFPSPTPLAGSVTGPVAITAGTVTLVFPIPAPAGVSLQPANLTTATIDLIFPKPAPRK